MNPYRDTRNIRNRLGNLRLLTCNTTKPVIWLTMLSNTACNKSQTTVLSGAVATGSVYAEGVEDLVWNTRSVSDRPPGMLPASGSTAVSHDSRLNDDLSYLYLAILPSHYHFVYYQFHQWKFLRIPFNLCAQKSDWVVGQQPYITAELYGLHLFPSAELGINTCITLQRHLSQAGIAIFQYSVESPMTGPERT